MKKYMGNKSRILERIYQQAQELAPGASTIFDAFAGTTNVGQYFKARGYTVISNDVNAVSRLLGEVYLKLDRLPGFERLFSSGCSCIRRLNALERSGRFQPLEEAFLRQNHNTNHSAYMESIRNTNAFKLLVYLSFAADESDVQDPFYSYRLAAPDFIWRNYCASGSNSEYFNLVTQKSIMAQIRALERLGGQEPAAASAIQALQSVYTPPYRMDALSAACRILEEAQSRREVDGSTAKIIQKLGALAKRNNHVGRRMFFSEEHGRRIDVINDLTLLWLKDGWVSQSEYDYLQCALVEAAALFSNTSATYQAFYKTYRENTMQQFRLVVPELIPSRREQHVYCADTFELIRSIQIPYDILYLDPPYNWRIYDSNYHLLNLIADFSRLADSILDYETGIAGAAGENRQLVRSYTNYNRRNTFEELLFQLIMNASCRYVMISYSDSRSNHNKNSLSSVERIEAFLTDPKLFVPGSYRRTEVGITNFESRKSEKKDRIHELLFAAEKQEE